MHTNLTKYFSDPGENIRNTSDSTAGDPSLPPLMESSGYCSPNFMPEEEVLADVMALPCTDILAFSAEFKLNSRGKQVSSLSTMAVDFVLTLRLQQSMLNKLTFTF